MPINYEIIDDQKIVLAVGSGIITVNDVIDHLNSLATDNGYKSPMKKLVDYRNVEKINILPDEAEQIAKRKKDLSSKFKSEKCAFVSPGDLTYGTARVHQALVDGSNIDTGVFRSFGEAVNWLGITLNNG